MPWHDGLVDAFPIPLDRLSLEDVAKQDMAAASYERRGPFEFLGLPLELRNQIYGLVLLDQRKTAILCAGKQCHEEGTRILYSKTAFRIFAKQEFKPFPTIMEIPLRHRKWVTTLEMVVGSSWTDPPKHWKRTKSLARCLSKCEAAHTLKIFVEADPSDRMFANFRISETFYTDFCGKLLDDVLDVYLQLLYVELDGHSFVNTEGPLVSRLREACEKQKKTVRWGKQNFRSQRRRAPNLRLDTAPEDGSE